MKMILMISLLKYHTKKQENESFKQRGINFTRTTHVVYQPINFFILYDNKRKLT